MPPVRQPKTLTLTLNPNDRSLYVAFSDTSEISNVLESESGKSAAGIRFASDGLPIVVDVEIYDDAKYTLIEDWIEEAVEAALGDAHGDDYYKANLIEA